MSSSATAPIALHDLNILATRIGEFDDAPPWLGSWSRAVLNGTCHRAHLAVMTGPYLRALLDSRKTIESRFTRNRVAPFEQVTSGEVVFFKPAAAPVAAAGFVTDALHIRLADVPLTEIARRFGESIAPADQSFWVDRAEAKFATLLTMGEVIAIPPMTIEKRDRRGWVVLNGTVGGARQATLF
jgi:hypothetical protein